MTVVVGTGPAGLTAAYLLAKRGEKVALVEPSAHVGGLWRGFDYPGGCHFETGMHWASDCGIPEIDQFWRGLLPADQVHEIPREIAGCWWDGRLQTNSPYPDVRGGKQFSNRPVLEKLWGVPLEELAPHADRLIKIDRAVAYNEEGTLTAYRDDPRKREYLAWPDQRTLPVEYQSGLSSFYPKAGLAALVYAAVAKLKTMGAPIYIGAPTHIGLGSPVIWAAGLKSAAEEHEIPWPEDMTPPRRITVVNMLIGDNSGDGPEHDLHYAFDYDTVRNPNKAEEHVTKEFRRSWYSNFAPTGMTHRVTVECLDATREEAVNCAVEPDSKILGVHDLGPVLPVPTTRNEELLDQVRDQLGQVPNLTLVGSGAKRGMFFQPEVLRHVGEVCA